jgi:uncharacterized membrane protein
MDDKVNSRNGFQPIERQTKETTNPFYDHQVQVGTASLLIGSGIALFGLTRRSVRGMALALVGAGVAVTGAKTRGAQSVRETVVHSVLTINKPRHEVYERWRRLEELPRDMRNLQSVEMTDERHSHWTAKGPLGRLVEWDAETTSQEQDTRITWRSLSDAPVPNHGSVRFSDAPNGRGTELNLILSCRLPGGRLGALFARLSGRHPRAEVESDLRRFKAILEAGEAPTTQDQPAGERSSIGRLANTWAAAR